MRNKYLCYNKHCPCHTPKATTSAWEEDYEIERNHFKIYDTSLHQYVIDDERLKSFIRKVEADTRREGLEEELRATEEIRLELHNGRMETAYKLACDRVSQLQAGINKDDGV